MLEALESMRTKEELCNYLKLIGIKDIEKTVEKLKQIYSNENFQGQALSFEQLDQVAGGLECFVDSHSRATFFTNDKNDLTLHIGDKKENYSIDNIKDLYKLHEEVFNKLKTYANLYDKKQLNHIYNGSKHKKDAAFLDKFIAKEQNALILKQKPKKISKPKVQSKVTNEVKAQIPKEEKIPANNPLDEEEIDCAHGIKVLAAILIFSGFGLGVTYLVPYLKKHKIKF